MKRSLQKADYWNFEMFSFFQLANENTLQYVSYYLFNKHGLFHKFHIDQKTFLQFFYEIEQGYLKNKNEFHNNLHAAEVLQTCHYIFSQIGVVNFFSDSHVFAAFLNCAIHDSQHDGFSQLFHQLANTDLTILYNDRSLHCNNSVSKAFLIALRQPGCNIFSGMSLENYRKTREYIIELSYGFDLSLYYDRIFMMKRLHRNSELSTKPLQILQHICHSCDISHCAKSWSIHSRNAGAGLEEFFLEGDKARDQGYKLSFMTNREMTNVIDNNIVFFELIVDETFLILGSCIQLIKQSSEYSVDVPTPEDDNLKLECESDSSRLNFRRIKAAPSFFRARSMIDTPFKEELISGELFPWTAHIAQNKQRWTEGGVFGCNYSKNNR